MAFWRALDCSEERWSGVRCHLRWLIFVLGIFANEGSTSERWWKPDAGIMVRLWSALGLVEKLWSDRNSAVMVMLEV